MTNGTMFAKGMPHPVDELVDEDLIADLQRGDHRAGRDAERLDEDGADEQRHASALTKPSRIPTRPACGTPAAAGWSGGRAAWISLSSAVASPAARPRSTRRRACSARRSRHAELVHRRRARASSSPVSSRASCRRRAQRARFTGRRAPDQHPDEPGHHQQPDPCMTGLRRRRGRGHELDEDHVGDERQREHVTGDQRLVAQSSQCRRLRRAAARRCGGLRARVSSGGRSWTLVAMPWCSAPPSSARPGRPPAGSPPSPPASSASCPPSASRGACAFG